MGQILHRSATTTEAIRRAIQHSQESLRTLSRRHGINPKTVAKWRKLSFGTEAYREISSKRTGQIQLVYGFGSWRWTVVSPFGNQETHRDTNRVDHLICSRQVHCGIGTTCRPPL